MVLIQQRARAVSGQYGQSAQDTRCSRAAAGNRARATSLLLAQLAKRMCLAQMQAWWRGAAGSCSLARSSSPLASSSSIAGSKRCHIHTLIVQPCVNNGCLVSYSLVKRANKRPDEWAPPETLGVV